MYRCHVSFPFFFDEKCCATGPKYTQYTSSQIRVQIMYDCRFIGTCIITKTEAMIIALKLNVVVKLKVSNIGHSLNLLFRLYRDLRIWFGGPTIFVSLAKQVYNLHQITVQFSSPRICVYRSIYLKIFTTLGTILKNSFRY